MKDRKSISKNEKWAKFSQKVGDDTVFKRLKDEQKHIRKSRWHNNTKTERWARAHQKVKDCNTIRKTKRWTKLILKMKVALTSQGHKSSPAF
jgi:hypothetical protein